MFFNLSPEPAVQMYLPYIALDFCWGAIAREFWNLTSCSFYECTPDVFVLEPKWRRISHQGPWLMWAYQVNGKTQSKDMDKPKHGWEQTRLRNTECRRTFPTPPHDLSTELQGRSGTKAKISTNNVSVGTGLFSSNLSTAKRNYGPHSNHIQALKCIHGRRV